MPELTIQFDAEPGTNADALAAQLKTELARIPAVNSVQSEVMESRDPSIALAATTIISVLATAPKVIEEATAIVNSIKNLIQATQGLKSAIVEIRGRRIPVDKLQPSDISPAASH